MSPKLNLLVAFPYLSNDVLKRVAEHQDKIRLFVDSGAFTAWKSGNPIVLEKYCNFIHYLPFKPFRYFALDVIGNPAATMENYNTMLNFGMNPVPIFTRGEDVSEIDNYYATSDLIGIGGLVGTRQNKGFVKGIMGVIQNRNVHWLGFTNHNFVTYYKPFSCDSSSWESGARFGAFRLYAGDGRFIFLKRENFKNDPGIKVRNLISTYGLDPYALSKEKNWRGGESINRVLNAHSIVRYMIDVEKRIGTKFFAAATTGLAVKLLIDGLLKEL